MKRKMIALVLICIMLICTIAVAEQDRPRLDAADRIVYRITNGKYRMLDMNGKFLGDDYDAFPSDQIGEAAVYMEHGRYGYAAKDGTILIEPDYLDLPRFENGYAVVRREDIDATEMDDVSGGTRFPQLYGAIDAYGDVVVPLKYDYVRIGKDADYAIVTDYNDNGNSTDGLFDLKQGKLLFDPRYYSINDLHGGTAVACECTIDPDAENTSGSEYTYRYGIIDVNGNELTPFDYDRIDYNEGFNAYTCYVDQELIKIYEIKDGTVVEKAD